MSNQIQVSSSESVSVQHRESGKTYTFYIGEQEDGSWLAFTYNSIASLEPRFCLECDDRDDALTAGYAAVRFHIMDLNSKPKRNAV